jgi:eukaryotic-like serine/threonine-protein kinase
MDPGQPGSMATPNPTPDTPVPSECQEKTVVSEDSNLQGGAFRDGDVIGGSYRVLQFIGAGGMGNVYRVFHTMMQQEYALKTLNTASVSPVAWRRFQNEAQAMARIKHPNIVAIYNLGLHDGKQPYYVMDLLSGKALSDVLSECGTLDYIEVASLFEEVCAGLGYAHKQGIVHRDLKPANIVLLDNPTNECRLKLVDFGIAKLGFVKDPKNQYLTHAGELCGSPLYMSPEQTLGQRVDARSDIYSLGCTLFEVLTGKPPLQGITAFSTMMMHQSTIPPSLREAAGREFPEMLEGIVATLMAKAPVDRYQTMELVAHDLKAVWERRQTPISSHSPQTGTPAGQRGPLERRPSQPHSSNIGLAQEKEAPGAAGHRPLKGSVSQKAEGETGRDYRRYIPAGLAALAIFAGLATTVWFYTTRTHSSAPVERAISKSMAKELSNNELWKEPDKYADALTHREIHSGAPSASLSSTKKYRVSIKRNGEIVERVYQFPDDITIGYLISPGMAETPAKGTVKITYRSKVYFKPSLALLDYPGYFGRFLPGDFDAVWLDATVGTNEILTYLAKYKIAECLALDGCKQIDKSGLVYLCKIPNLKIISFEKCGFDADALADQPLVPKLVNLNCIGEQSTDKLLSKLEYSQYLNAFDLCGSNITHAGFKSIATMSRLLYLGLRGAHFDAQDLILLTKLPYLNTVDLQGCEIDTRTLQILQCMKHLRTVKLSDDKLKGLTKASVQVALPRVSLGWSKADQKSGQAP